MAEHSKIEWTDATWNPVTGCTKVSPGCAHCYAERITNRFGGPGAFDKVVLHTDRLELPLHWRKPRLVFVNSMSDLFHENVPFEFVARVWYTITRVPDHTFQILTKRPQRMLEFAQWMAGDDDISIAEWPRNVWLGVSVENQRMADKRIPLLLQTPAAVRWLSVEPLLAPVDLTSVHLGGWIYREPGKREPQRFNVLQERTVFYDEGDIDYPKIDWVVVGGESGPEARPMHPAWARALRDQCVEAGVPFFFKQWGEWLPIQYVSQDKKALLKISVAKDDPKERIVGEGEQAVNVVRVGKKKAGRLLDGREWNQMPGAVPAHTLGGTK